MIRKIGMKSTNRNAAIHQWMNRGVRCDETSLLVSRNIRLKGGCYLAVPAALTITFM